MSRWDLKTGTAGRALARTIKHSPRTLSRLVGRALGLGGGAQAGRARSFRGMESLEQRQLLEGNFATATLISLNGAGAGTSAGAITPANATTDNDYYKFVMPGANGTSNFVTILADTRNEGATGSPLDTRVTIFTESDLVTPLVSGVTNPNAAVVTGVNNGTLTTGLAKDGWGGFIGQGGVTYYVIVSSDSSVSAPVAGSYTVRVQAGSTGMDVDPDSGIESEAGTFTPPPPPVPPTAIAGTLDILEQDKLYRYVAPTDAAFRSLVAVNIQAGQLANVAARLDARLDIYKQTDTDGRVQRIAFDSDAGRLNDSFATFLADAGATYWIRVRSDEIRPGSTDPGAGTGSFFVVMDGRADELPLAMNPVTRLASDPGGAFVAFGPPTVPPTPAVPNPVFQMASYRFIAQGTGLAIITGVGNELDPVNNPALRLFDDTGAVIAFNDNFAGLQAQISAQIVGGREYYVVIDGFEATGGTQYGVFVESNHTFNANPGTTIDDHTNVSNNLDSTDPVVREQNRLAMENATPLVWSDPFLTFDADGNIVRDRGLRVQATGTGRIQGAGDTDVFQFTPPTDMLGQVVGNNDDAGVSLFAGGRFDVGDPNGIYPTLSRSLTSYDGGDWWYTGDQRFDNANNVQLGFTANTAASGKPEIYAMLDWDSNPTADPANGTTDHFLWVGGDFTLTIPGAFGPVTIRNLALWGWNNQARKFQWFQINGITEADAPVRAFTQFDPQGFDPDGSGPEPALVDPGANWVVAGGDFTNIGGTAANRIAFFDETFAWNPIGSGITGANASVRSLAVYDPPDPGEGRAASAGPPVLQAVADAPDVPSMVFVGGVFTNAGNIASRNLAAWSGQNVIAGRIDNTNATGSLDAGDNEARIGRWNTPNFGTQPQTTPPPDLNHPSGPRPAWNTGTRVIDGAVDSMVLFTEMPDFDGAGPIVQGDSYLVLGGAFTQIGGAATVGTTAGRIALYGAKDPNQDSGAAAYSPRLLWSQAGVASGFEVFAMTVWNPVDNVGGVQGIQEKSLVIGGAALGIWGPTEGVVATLALPQLADGSAGSIRSLAAFTDQQEPQIPLSAGLGGTDPQEVLYFGGIFDQIVDPNAPPPPVPVPLNNVAGFAFDQNAQTFQAFSLGQQAAGGVGNADPNDPSHPGVFALATYAEKDPFRWDHHDRPATRLAITVAPNFGGFENAFIQLYDSNFNLVYSNDTINPLGPDPAGAIDNSLTDPSAPPNSTWLIPAEIWGGEVYYLVVRDANGGGTGRYNVTVVADAPPPVDPALGLPDQPNGHQAVETREGNFAQSPNLPTALASGDTNLNINSATPPIPLNGRSSRNYIVNPSTSTQIQQVSDLGSISSIDDTDLWNFRAEFTGTVEVRINTRDIADQFGEAVFDIVTGQFTGFTGNNKVYQSPLDSAVRIFDNDFTQIAYDNDNFAVQGELTQNVIVGQGVGNGGTNTADFYKRDARIVFHVVAGNFYYIQVESGQRYVDGSPAAPEDRVNNLAKEIDWRRVSGSYQMFINQMPFVPTDIENGQTVQDDYAPSPLAQFNALFAASIPLGDNQSDPTTNGAGSMLGVINNTPNNPVDFDDFTFIANGSGSTRISVTPTQTGSTLSAQLLIADLDNPNGGQITGAPAGNGVVAATIDVIVGHRYAVRVGSNGGTEGAYRLDVTPVPGATGAKVRDDFADRGQFWKATDIPLLDFQGSGTISGNIEVAGDTDVFRFSVVDFALFTVSVNAVTPTFNPAVDVYEISEDPSGNPIALRIATGDDINANNTNSRTTFPVTPNRIVQVQPPGENREYPFYYVVVRGSNPQGDIGQYTVTLNFPATDDHPDAPLLTNGISRDTTQYGLASAIAVDNLTGLGSSSGVIELAGDTDLFSFTAPASGPTTVTVTRPATSTIRTRIVILADGIPGSASVTLASAVAPDSASDGTATITFNVSRGVRYLMVVEGFGPPNANTTKLGAYNISVAAPPIDDYPNDTEWSIASAILINSTTGTGQVGGSAFGDSTNAHINPANDTDLFKVTTTANGTYTFTVNTFAQSGNGFAARIRIYDNAHNLIDTVTAGTDGQQITSTITGTTAGSTYFILVDSVGTITATNNEYRLVVSGPTGTGGGNGPDPSVVDFNNPTVIPLDQRTGNGQLTASISVPNERDLFTFTTFNFSGPGFTFVQIVTPEGTLLDATVRILRNPNELASSEVVFDADGIPGATANAAFTANPNTQYWVIVDGVGTTVGSYTIRVSSRPGQNFLYFPEGYASNTINSQVAITNPNDVQANFSIVARYETGTFETVLATGTVEPNGTVRQTISGSATARPAGLRTDAPFSLVIVSDVAVGATFTHTDFGGSLGEAFTNKVAPTWDFARVERTPGGNLDFILLYNPNGFDVEVTLTAYQSGTTPVAITFKVGALRRGGLAINDVPTFPRGIFSVVVTSRAADSAFDSSFQGVVASQSHYDLVSKSAYAALGDQGATTQVVSSFSQGINTTSDLTLFNPGTSATTITLTGTYISAGLPGISRTFDLQPKSQLHLLGTDLSLIADQHIGLRFRSSSNISVLATQEQHGEADATATSADAGTRFFFGDAFINTVGAGNLYFQTLNVYNPTTSAININVRILFADGTTSLITLANVAGRGYSELRLHERPEIVTQRTGDVLFALDATSTSPFVATLTGYDVTKDSGWTIAGQPFGLTNPLSRI